jgi:hypothetical protein
LSSADGSEGERRSNLLDDARIRNFLMLDRVPPEAMPRGC